jgi:hypothetical protein
LEMNAKVDGALVLHLSVISTRVRTRASRAWQVR